MNLADISAESERYSQQTAIRSRTSDVIRTDLLYWRYSTPAVRKMDHLSKGNRGGYAGE